MNKQIKELEEYLKYITQHKTWTTKKLAQQLTKQGYQKVDKDSIMLSREEYKTLLDNAIRLDMEYLEHEKAKVRKKTAREIFAKIKQKGQFEYFAYDDDKYCVSSDNLEELAKQYGVDLGEEQ